MNAKTLRASLLAQGIDPLRHEVLPRVVAGSFCALMLAAVNSVVCGAGLTTAVQPAASAGASARTSRTAGAFQGTMMAATPAGSRSIVENTPGSTSSTWPGTWRASPA
mgnify:CR=1 FL=1